MRKLLLCLLFLSILIFPSWVHADPSTYLNIPPTNAFDKIHSDNGTISAVNFSMPLTVKGGSGISVQSSNASHTLTITNTATPNTHNGSYNTTQANNVNINSGGYKINFINGTGATVNLKNSGSGNQVNVTVSATGTSSGVSSLNALTGALTIACVSGNTTCTTSGGNTITVNTAYNVVVTGGSAQTITKGITHTADLTMSGANIQLGGNKLILGTNGGAVFSAFGTSGEFRSTLTNTTTYLFILPNGKPTAPYSGLMIHDTDSFSNTNRIRLEFDATNGYLVNEKLGNATAKPMIVKENGINAMSFNVANTITNLVDTLFKTKITQYNSINTAGWGVPAIYGSGRLTGLTGASGTVTSYTVGASDGTFEVSGDITATTSTTYAFKYLVTWTDETGTSRTLPLQGVVIPSSIVSPTVQDSRGPIFSFPPETIRAKAGTTITLATDPAGTYTTVTYNIDGIIKQIS